MCVKKATVSRRLCKTHRFSLFFRVLLAVFVREKESRPDDQNDSKEVVLTEFGDHVF